MGFESWNIHWVLPMTTIYIWLFFLQACKLKLGDFKGALLEADFAMRDGENNAKALFRQGQVSSLIKMNVRCYRFVILIYLQFMLYFPFGVGVALVYYLHIQLFIYFWQV